MPGCHSYSLPHLSHVVNMCFTVLPRLPVPNAPSQENIDFLEATLASLYDAWVPEIKAADFTDRPVLSGAELRAQRCQASTIVDHVKQHTRRGEGKGQSAGECEAMNTFPANYKNKGRSTGQEVPGGCGLADARQRDHCEEDAGPKNLSQTGSAACGQCIFAACKHA